MNQPDTFFGTYLFTFDFFDHKLGESITYNISGDTRDFIAYRFGEVIGHEQQYPKEIAFWRFTDEIQYTPGTDYILAQEIIKAIKAELEVREKTWIAHPFLK